MDAAGDLFGTTGQGGAGGTFGFGTVYELAKTASGYASAPTIIADFSGANGSAPHSLIMDGAGDIFGVAGGGSNNDGVVFEIAKTAGGYAAPADLFTFNGNNGENPSGLVRDAAGALFGLTTGGGSGGPFGPGGGFDNGTVFELIDTGGVYTLNTEFNFNTSKASNIDPTGFTPSSGLSVDAAGDLFGGTTLGGPNGYGTIFEVTGTGFQVAAHDLIGVGMSDLLIQNTAGAVVVVQVAGGQASYTAVAALGQEWKFEGTGAFLGNGDQGFLIENSAGAVVVGDASSGQASYTQVAALGPEWTFHGTGDFLGHGSGDQFLIENTAGTVAVGEVTGQAAYTAVGELGPEWTFEGVGNFLGDGKSDFLIQNTAGAVVVGEVGSNNQASYTLVTALGPEWKFEGAGAFLNDGRTGFLIENASGAVVVGEVVNGQTQFTQIAALGPEWTFKGAGDYLGEGHDQFLIENTAGAVALGDWTGGAIHYTQIAGLGPEWSFH